MKYEFIKNGEVTLKLKPEDAIDQAFFKALFEGEVEVINNSTANNTHGEVTIKVKKVKPVSIIDPHFQKETLI